MAKNDSAVVFTQDIQAVRRMCKLVQKCWVPSVSGHIPCRADGDERSIVDLPTLAPHRWVWAVVNGFSFDPGLSIHVRRVCSTKRCCNPEHLYATTADGDRLSKTEFRRRMTLLKNSDAPRAPRGSAEIVVNDLSQLKSMCSTDNKQGCWIPLRSGRVALRAAIDRRDDAELPKYAPHRAAFVLASGNRQQLSSTDHIRRRCVTKRCCNPDHLYLEQVGVPSPRASSVHRGTHVALDELEKTSRGLAVVSQRLDHVEGLCRVTESGCWIPDISNQVACRAENDSRPADDLPRMRLHRWTWLVANGRAGEDFPGDRVHVRRRCSSRHCCNPDHLYAQSPYGEELSLEDIFGSRIKDVSPAANSTDAEKSQLDNDEYLRRVLMF